MVKLKNDLRCLDRLRGSVKLLRKLEELVYLFVLDMGDGKLECKRGQDLTDLQNGENIDVRQRAAVEFHDGDECVKCALFAIVRDISAAARNDFQKSLVRNLRETGVHNAAADLHGLGQLPFGGELLADSEFSGENHVFELFDKKLLQRRRAELVEFHGGCLPF